MKQALSSFGIGASEVAAVSGMSPFASPWSVWRSKVEGLPVTESPEMEWGLRIEPALRQKYADQCRSHLYVPIESMFHPSMPWARATPDAIAVGPGYEPEHDRARWEHLVQCKNVGYWPGKGWDSGPPDYVQLQEQWELYVTGLSRADVAALIGGSDFRVYTVHRDDRIIADLVDICSAFWRRIETRTPPVVDDSDACADHFRRRLARHPSAELVANEHVEKLVASWRAARRDQRTADKRVKTLRNQIRAAMDEAQCTRIISSNGTPRLAQSAVKTQHEVNWQYVAQMLGATLPNEYAALVEAATTTTTIEAAAKLLEPSEWSKEDK